MAIRSSMNSTSMIVGLEHGKYLFVRTPRDMQRVARDLYIGKFVDLLKPPESLITFKTKFGEKVVDIHFTPDGEIIVKE